MESPPPAMSSEDMELLNSLTVLNTLDHDMLLSGLHHSSSSMGITCDGFLEHHDKWSLPPEPNFSSWKLHDFPSSDHCQHDDVRAHAASSKAVSGSAERKNSSLAVDSQGVQTSSRRSDPASDQLKQFDSSDNSDAMDDDDGDKHSPNGKAPMSKNLVSERRRRKKLNERLYSLRAIVPIISKMDKASIVGDAITYVRDLQKQVEEMQADIRALQSDKGASPEGSPARTNGGVAAMRRHAPSKSIPDHKILELEVSKMEEQTYNLRIHCKKGPGVLVQLTQALEALDFEIVNANLTSISDRILNTIVVKVKNDEVLETEELRKMALDVIPRFGLHL